MIPTNQLEKDDCLSACIASILEIDSMHIPNFHYAPYHSPDGKKFWNNVDHWFDNYKYKYELKYIGKNTSYCELGYVIAAYPHSLGYHAIILLDGIPVFDPAEFRSWYNLKYWNNKTFNWIIKIFPKKLAQNLQIDT